MKPRLIFCLALLLVGCHGRTQSRYAYPYENIAGPSVDTEIKYYKERLVREDVPGRPKNFGDRNILAGLYLTKAQNTFDPGYFTLAAQTARESLESMPTRNIPPKLVLASVAEAGHDFEGCLEQAKAVYDQDNNNMEAIGLMASCYLETGRTPEARPLADYLSARAPTLAASLLQARILAGQGKDQQAVQAVQEGLRHEQPQDRRTSARARSLLGEIAMRRGQLPLARQLFEYSLAVEPRNPLTLADAARLAERSGDLEGAAHFCGQAFDNSSNPALLVQLAHVRSLQNKSEEAQKLWGKAEEMLAPELEKGGYGHARDLARLWLDRNQGDDAQKALALMEQQVKKRHDVASLTILAEAQQRNGKAEQAQATLEEILATGVEDPELMLRTHSEKWAQKAREIDPKAAPSPW